MVDALREANRVLAPEGALLDLRPVAELSRLECALPEGGVLIGELDTSALAPDDRAADEAIEQAARLGWFIPTVANQFKVEFRWSQVADLAAYVSGGRQPKRVHPSCDDLFRVCGTHTEPRA